MTTDINTTKKMLAGFNLSDKELEEIRDTCDTLAEITVDGWFEKRKQEICDRRKINEKC
ncbi:MAG: hypothetical protein Q7S43_02160 [bacterium]|nr:hypothetical protein [bacterium]